MVSGVGALGGDQVIRVGLSRVGLVPLEEAPESPLILVSHARTPQKTDV